MINYLIDCTSTTATVMVSGLSSTYPFKIIDYYLGNDLSGNSYARHGDPPDGIPMVQDECTYEGLTPNTTYPFAVTISYKVAGEWEVEDRHVGTFTTLPDGGTDDMWFTFTYTSSNVTVTVNNAGDYWFGYYLYDETARETIFDGDNDDYRTPENPFTMPVRGSLTEGHTYTVGVSWSYDQYGGTPEIIYSQNGRSYEEFTVSGGGGGDEWSINSYNLRTVDDGDPIYVYSGHPAYYTIDEQPLRFNTAGTVTLTSYDVDQDTGMRAFISTDEYFDDQSGEPDGTILDSDTRGAAGFVLEFEADTSTTYYLWIRTATGMPNPSTFFVLVEIDGSGPGPTPTGNTVWIRSSSGWVRAIPWVRTSSEWKQAIPWIYTSSGWKQTT